MDKNSDIAISLQFVKQNLPKMNNCEYLKIFERVFNFLSSEEFHREIVALKDFANDKWHWNLICLKVIRTQ